ncbi:MAG: HD domain-containing protein [Candidatus Niyogibacteria bacterium]|nr:HD domain-containing protein [Candidatus Niyogibacteria bacterium]
MKYNIPKEIRSIYTALHNAGFEAYLVGGCVRDLVLSEVEGLLHKPKDWDVTTNAMPEEIQSVFPESVYENNFGTVGVKSGAKDETLKIVEITPFRIEAKYSDKRHPDEVKFAKKLDDDLKRRDFTVNALAFDIKNEEIIDLFDGENDLKNKIIRAVGKPEERFGEDALRMLRAVRLSAELGFAIEEETKHALAKNASLLRHISQERIRDEFSKIIMSDNPVAGFETMRELGILKYILPEIEEGWGVGQNKHHIYTVWEHSLRALMHAVENSWSLQVRIAALLHDVGKPRTKRGEGKDSTFYGHEVVGAKMAKGALSRLRFSKKIIDDVYKLVRWHLFFSDTEVVTLSAVRRIVRNVGEDIIEDLLKVRYCDRIGMGRPKERPYRLRKYESMIEEALRSPLSVGQLAVHGDDVMKICKMDAGPRIGFILHVLLEEVLDDPSKNTRNHQEKRVGELCALSDEELKKMGVEAKKRKEQEEEKEVAEIRKKYFVK